MCCLRQAAPLFIVHFIVQSQTGGAERAFDVTMIAGGGVRRLRRERLRRSAAHAIAVEASRERQYSMRQIKKLHFDSPGIGCWWMYFLPPPPELAPFVEVFWEVHGFATFARDRILPKTTVELIFNLGPPHRLIDPTRPGGEIVNRDAWVSGLQQRPLIVQPCFDAKQVQSHIIGVGLRPAGAYAFFGMPMSEIANDVIDLDALAASRFSIVHARLLETASRPDRFGLLEALVRERMAAEVRVRPFIHWATAQIERAHGAVRIVDLCRELGVSRKHLHKWFRQQVGLPPKQYANVARFQRLVACLVESTPPAWSEVAQRCGFSDQSHLVHDCRAFAGMTPTALRASLSPDGIGAVES